MTRPTVVGVWENSGQTDALGVTIPAGSLQAGDTLVLSAVRDTTGSDTITFAEAGWLESGTDIVLGNLNFTNGNAKCGYRIASEANASDLTYTVNGATSRGLAAQIIAIRGHTTTPIDRAAAESQAASTTSTPPSIAVDADESLYVAIGCYSSNYGTVTPPTDHTIENENSYTVTQDVYQWVSSFAADTADSPVASGYTHTNSVIKALYSIVFSPYTAGGGTVNTETLESAIAVSDESPLFMLRHRILESLLSVNEGDTIVSEIINLISDDALSVSDGVISSALRNRLLEDSVTVTDDDIAAVIGYLIFVEVLSSEVAVTDEALPYRLFERLLDSNLLTTDEALRALQVTRSLMDSVDISDEGLTSLQRYILLSDALSIEDDLASEVITPLLINPVIVIGFDQPDIQLGGYAI